MVRRKLRNRSSMVDINRLRFHRERYSIANRRLIDPRLCPIAPSLSARVSRDYDIIGCNGSYRNANGNTKLASFSNESSSPSSPVIGLLRDRCQWPPVSNACQYPLGHSSLFLPLFFPSAAIEHSYHASFTWKWNGKWFKINLWNNSVGYYMLHMYAIHTYYLI